MSTSSAEEHPGRAARPDPAGGAWRLSSVAESCALALLPALVASIPTAFRTRAAGGGLLDGWVVGTAVWLCLLLPMALLRRRAARGWRGLVGADPPADLGIALALWTGLAVALLLLLGALLKSTTHHRGLGGAAFAGVGLGAVAGAAVITPRLLALRAAVHKRHVPKWVVAGITGLLALGPTILAATPALERLLDIRLRLIDASDYALLAWAETVFPAAGIPLDGVWWLERYDPLALSAPRGGIFPAQVPSWHADPLDWAAVLDDEDLLASTPDPGPLTVTLP